MKARYIQRGDSIDITPTADVAAGDIVKLGNLVGVAKLDIKAGELGALALTGVYEIGTSGTAIGVGAVVYVDPTTGKVCGDTAPGAIRFGTAVSACTDTETLVNVRLEQGS